MSFFRKNRSRLIILLLAGFFIAILVTFVSGISGSKSNPTPTDDVLSGPSVLATSTGNGIPSADNGTPTIPRSEGTQALQTPVGTFDPPPGVTIQAVTESALPVISSPPPTVEVSITEISPGTDAPPPPTIVFVDETPPGTDFPPPLTFVPLPTETPPPGNGPPPGS